MTKNIVRVNKTKNYTVMSNMHLNDKRLSWKAKGIHSYVLSLPDDWKIILSHLETVSTDGDKSLRSGLKELYDLRYWQKYPIYVDGKVTQWVTEIYEEPFSEKDKIKNIVIKNNKKTINYRNDRVEVEIIDSYLLCPFGEVDEGKSNTEVDLLPQKVEVGNVEIDKVEVDKDRLLNTNNTKDLSFTKDSFNHSKELSTDKKKNEGMIEFNTNNFKEILSKTSYESFGEHSLVVKQAIRLLYFSDKPLKINNMSIPPSQVREDLKELSWYKIDCALRDFKTQAEQQEIRNITSYLSRCIYNSIFDCELKLDAQVRYNSSI